MAPGLPKLQAQETPIPPFHEGRFLLLKDPPWFESSSLLQPLMLRLKCSTPFLSSIRKQLLLSGKFHKTQKRKAQGHAEEGRERGVQGCLKDNLVSIHRANDLRL